MPELFSREDIEKFFPLTDDRSREGKIRGPRDKWDLKGSILCGKYTSINGSFKARGRVNIGSYCAFGDLVSLVSGNHRTDLPNQQLWLNARFGFMSVSETKGSVEIGHNVWIGDKASVLSGVKVGHGSVIGAGAVVAKSVPPFAIVVGNPARVVRYRFAPSVIEQMLDLNWWHWDDNRIGRNKAFFELSISPDDVIDLRSYVVA